MKARNNLFRFGLAGLILVYLLFWMPLPYVVIQPGSAENLADMVNIPDGHMEQKGSFMLTTVRISYPHSNTASLLYAYLHPFAHAVPRSEFFRGETADEYSQRQEYVMATSQSNAIQVALREAGIPYEIRTTGVMVLGTVEGMQAAEVLQPGDRILSLNGTGITTTADLLAYIRERKIGEDVKVTYRRGEESRTETITLADLSRYSDNVEESRPGLGIMPVDIREIVSDRIDVRISAGDIGGPSAGLMFALQIYNRLSEQDITNGYRIAGTGTISPEGEIGIIGGVDYKVVAADREGADVFFAPEGNAALARQTAERIGTSMTVVSVKQFRDALDYLASLPEPENNGD